MVRQLSLRLHPDKNNGSPDAAKAFADLVTAYEILGDPDTRTAFDDFGGAENEAFDTFREYAARSLARRQRFPDTFCMRAHAWNHDGCTYLAGESA